MPPEKLIGLILSILALATYIWKAATDYQKLKDLAERQKEMPTKLDIANMEAGLLKVLREEFVTKEELKLQNKLQEATWSQLRSKNPPR